MFLVYNIVLTLLAPIWGPWMWLRARRRQPMPNWKQRFGQYDLPRHENRIWFHAVSVGEVVAAKPILQAIRRKLPEYDLVLSVTTSSGFETAQPLAGDVVNHVIYFPIDVARFQLGAIQTVRPKVAVLMETELWFNFLWAANVFDVPVVLVNGRISERSFRGMNRVAPLYKQMAKWLKAALMQAAPDAERITTFGAKDVRVLGNCKFDQAVESGGKSVAEWQAELGLLPEKPLVIFGSIRHEEFDECLAEAKKLTPDYQVVFAPRHIDRKAEIEGAYAKHFSGPIRRRSAGEKLGEEQILILDSYGELSALYAVASLAVVGGGFADLGGQNIIQPLAHGVPVIHGPNMRNFRDVAASAKGTTQVVSSEIATTARQLLADPARLRAIGEEARAFVAENTGASERYAEAIVEVARSVKGKVKK